MPHVNEAGEKLSVIMESTKEYASTSSASSGTNRTVLTINRDDLSTIKEQSISKGNFFVTVVNKLCLPNFNKLIYLW